MLTIERLLLTIALAHVAAGASLTMLPLVPPVHFALAAAIFGEGRATQEVLFLVSVFGPTVASWGILFFALVKAYFHHPSSGSWWALVLSIVVWAPLDSALCLYYGLNFAVALNAVIALAIVGLLFGVRGLADAKHVAAQQAAHRL